MAPTAAQGDSDSPPVGVLFVYEAHPLVPLWTWEPSQVRVREDRSYFARWRPEHLGAVAAWDGRVPNSFSLLARRV